MEANALTAGPPMVPPSMNNSVHSLSLPAFHESAILLRMLVSLLHNNNIIIGLALAGQ